MLLYRMLRGLGYDKIRYVVDWADHIWVEAWLGDGVHDSSDANGGRWVLLDPCEADVDNPLLYESWGKNQTYIDAFHDPFYESSSSGNARADSPIASLVSSNHVNEMSMSATVADAGSTLPSSARGLSVHEKDILTHSQFPLVEDRTHYYTSDEAHVIRERRGIAEEPVAEAIGVVSRSMAQLLQKLMQH